MIDDILYNFLNSKIPNKIFIGVSNTYTPGQVLLSATNRMERLSPTTYRQEYIIDCFATKENPYKGMENALLLYSYLEDGQNQIQNQNIKSITGLTLPYDNSFTTNGLKVASFSINVTYLTSNNSLEIKKV